MNKLNASLVGVFAVITAALFFGTTKAFLSPYLFHLPVILVIFLQNFIAAIALLPFFSANSYQLSFVSKRQWAAIFWVAIVVGSLGPVFFTKAISLTSDISVVLILQKLQPVFALILAALFLHERFPFKFYLFIVLAFIGAYLVTFRDPKVLELVITIKPLVLLYAVLAALAWGSGTVFGKYAMSKINAGLMAFLRSAFASVFLLFFAAYYFNRLFFITGEEWQVLVIMAFISSALVWWMYYYGLKRISASVAALCEMTWPAAVVILDYIINRNIFSWTQIGGMLIIVISVYFLRRVNQPHVISGVVTAGEKMGHNLGARTANLDISLAGSLSPGLYSCQVVAGHETYFGLLYFGINYLSQKLCLEAHLLNFSGDLYGKKLIITVNDYLRSPKKVSGPSELAKLIQKDLALAKKMALA